MRLGRHAPALVLAQLCVVLRLYQLTANLGHPHPQKLGVFAVLHRRQAVQSEQEVALVAILYRSEALPSLLFGELALVAPVEAEGNEILARADSAVTGQVIGWISPKLVFPGLQ